MNRVGLKDYLLNHADDNDLLDCAKAYDAANQYGHFDTYDSVEEAAKLCGYGHFCADLDDAHGFCERFAAEIVGVGESLDDMCENRREVASMAQDVDAEDRGLEDKNHDNSEIGE